MHCDYEPITKKVKEYLEHLLMSDQTKGELLALCDNIDAVHRTLEQENERLRDASKRGDAEHGWYRALDADEKSISIGDTVEHNGVVANVLGITFHGTTPPTVCICRGDCWVEADELHHHALTVEDVLREFAADFVGCANYVDDHEVTDAIELFAPKLRLAGEGE